MYIVINIISYAFGVTYFFEHMASLQLDLNVKNIMKYTQREALYLRSAYVVYWRVTVGNVALIYVLQYQVHYCIIKSRRNYSEPDSTAMAQYDLLILGFLFSSSNIAVHRALICSDQKKCIFEENLFNFVGYERILVEREGEQEDFVLFPFQQSHYAFLIRAATSI